MQESKQWEVTVVMIIIAVEENFPIIVFSLSFHISRR